MIAGLTAGVTQGATDYFFGDAVPTSGTDPLDDFLAANNNFADVDVGLPGDVPGGTGATPTPVDMSTVSGTELPPLEVPPGAPPEITPVTPEPVVPSPLNQIAADVAPTDYLNQGTQSGFGIKAPKFDPMAPLPRDLAGNIDYSLTAGMDLTGPGLQLPSSPNISSMGGGQGLTVDVAGLPEFRYSMDSLDPSIRGTTDSWFGDSGQVYGNATPSGTIGEYGFTPTPDLIEYGPTSPAAPRSLTDKLKNFDFADINSSDMKNLAGKAVDYAIENPLTTLAGITLATGVLSQDAPPNAQPNPGSTRNSSFTRPMDQYNYLRQQQQYGGDFTKYGQAGGEHQFFTPSRFDLVTPPPVAAKAGGLMQMRQAFQAGGRAAPMNPRMMQTGMPAGGMGRGMPMRGGLNQAMQTGNMPPAGSSNMPQGRPQPVNRNARTSYYQYGTPPGGAPKPGMAAGGAFNMVRSYNMGGGADGRSDDVEAVLSDGEYVFDAETVALLGNGSSEAGATRLDQMREQIRKQKGKSLAQGKISPDAQSPLSYLKRS